MGRHEERMRSKVNDHRFKIMNVTGARPNMMKVAPLVAEMRNFSDLHPILVHTGQHYDYSMSEVFFEQLHMPKPDYNLGVGSGSHHSQTAEVMKLFGELVQQDRPHLIVVVGDVNSTMACALVAAKEQIPLAHVEAGLRSFDRTMPEEINRLVTDQVSDLLLTTEDCAGRNLEREGIANEKIFFAGNAMIDSLVGALDKARRSMVVARLGLPMHGYAVLTLHRPSNVDDPHRLSATLAAIAEIATRLPVIFPVHPRTANRIAEATLNSMTPWDGRSSITTPGIWTLPPAAYLDFIGLVDQAAMVITDSGGIQEESTYLGVPCLTFRDNTERPVTITHGTNRLVGTDPANLVREANSILCDGQSRKTGPNGYHPPPLWDGHASQRIVRIFRDYLQTRYA
jgi:UDP-N-acetylglucosamine 2-epimerase (non-hydrolysing)